MKSLCGINFQKSAKSPPLRQKFGGGAPLTFTKNFAAQRHTPREILEDLDPFTKRLYIENSLMQHSPNRKDE